MLLSNPQDQLHPLAGKSLEPQLAKANRKEPC